MMLTVSTQLSREDDLVAFERMLSSVATADEIIVFNMERTDAEFERICNLYKTRIIKIKTPPVVEVIRNRQISESSHEWVLVMDYDEVITKELMAEIKNITKTTSPQISGYFITRRNYSLGYPVKHGGYGADAVPRLFYKNNFVNWPSEIHSMPSISGNYGYCQGVMEHHKDASLAQMVAKTNRYSAVEARQFSDGGLPTVTPVTLLRKSIMEFVRRYFFKVGFLDGRIGLLQAMYQGYSVFLSYAKLYELQIKKSK